MAQTDDPIIAQVDRLSNQLDKRVAGHELREPYIEGEAPYPAAVEQARLTKLYRYLMPVAEAPWGSLVVDSKLDRLEVSGIRDEDENAAKRIWDEAWQPNSMDAESKLGHGAALLDGRFFATVWVDPDTGKPDIALDDSTQMIVEFADGSRRKRTGALRRWVDGERVYATLYRPDGIYKYQGPEGHSAGPIGEGSWEKREVDGEKWPLPNPLEVVPVVELRVNPRLKPGKFPFARGEFAHCTGLIDRINLLTFLGLVIAFWMGFPMRGVIGDKIRREVLVNDEGEPILDEEGKKKTKAKAPFELQPDSVFQLENPDAKIVEYSAADRKNLSVFAELDQLAVITKTPRHYFPMEGGMSNLSAEAIMASEGGMHAAVTGHQSSLGEGWEEVCRLAGMILGVSLSSRAEMVWTDHQSRSLAERADAATKLKDIFPMAAVAEIALGASQGQIDRWTADRAMDPLMQLVAAAQAPQAGNGAVPSGVPAG